MMGGRVGTALLFPLRGTSLLNNLRSLLAGSFFLLFGLFGHLVAWRRLLRAYYLARFQRLDLSAQSGALTGAILQDSGNDFPVPVVNILPESLHHTKKRPRHIDSARNYTHRR